jgi:hypothetical protein
VHASNGGSINSCTFGAYSCPFSVSLLPCSQLPCLELFFALRLSAVLSLRLPPVVDLLRFRKAITTINMNALLAQQSLLVLPPSLPLPLLALKSRNLIVMRSVPNAQTSLPTRL